MSHRRVWVLFGSLVLLAGLLLGFMTAGAPAAALSGLSLGALSLLASQWLLGHWRMRRRLRSLQGFQRLRRHLS